MESASSKHCSAGRLLPHSSLIVCGGNDCSRQRCQLPTSVISSTLLSPFSLSFFVLFCFVFRSHLSVLSVVRTFGASCSFPLEVLQSGRNWHVNSWDMPVCPQGTALPTRARDSLPALGLRPHATAPERACRSPPPFI